MPNFPTSLDADSSLLVALDFSRDTLRGSMTNVQATIPVNVATNFPDPAGATYYVVINAADSTNREICGYTGRDLTGGANALTGVTRAPFGPAAATHSIGMSVELNIVSKFHEFPKAAIIAIETKMGIDGSATTSTFDYKLNEVTGADKAVGKSATQTLTNKTLTSPTLNTPTIGTSATLSSATFKVVPGVTSVAFRNNADNADNLAILDNGNIAVRGTLSGITTLTATTLAGTLSTAAQTAITSVGTLTSLAITNGLTLGGDELGTTKVEFYMSI